MPDVVPPESPEVGALLRRADDGRKLAKLFAGTQLAPEPGEALTYGSGHAALRWGYLNLAGVYGWLWLTNHRLVFRSRHPFGPKVVMAWPLEAIALAEPALNLGIIPSRLLIALHNGERVILDVGPFPFGRRRSWVRAIDLAKDQAKS